MRTIAATIAAAVLGTGCIITSSDPVYSYGDVNVYWRFVRHAPAQPGGAVLYDKGFNAPGTGVCPDSAVDTVRVIYPGGSQDVDCTMSGVQGLQIRGLLEGNNTFRVIGYRGAYAVYDSGSISLPVSSATTLSHDVDVPGVADDMDIFGYLAFGTPPGTLYASCAAAGNPNIGFEIWDSFGTLVDDGLVGCEGVLPAPVFASVLDRDNYEVRLRGYELGTNAVVFDSCRQLFDHFGPQVGANGFAPVMRTLPVPTCP